MDDDVFDGVSMNSRNSRIKPEDVIIKQLSGSSSNLSNEIKMEGGRNEVIGEGLVSPLAEDSSSSAEISEGA